MIVSSLATTVLMLRPTIPAGTWGESRSGTLTVQILNTQLVPGGHDASAGDRNVWQLALGRRLDAAAERHLNMTDPRHHLPKSKRFDGSGMVGA